MEQRQETVWRTEDWFSGQDLNYCRAFFHRLQGTLETHSCTFYELNIVVEGSANHYVNDTVYEALQGSIYFIPPGVCHGYQAERGAVIFHAFIRPVFFEQYERELRSMAGYSLLFEIDPYLRTETFISLPFRLMEENYTLISPIIENLIRNDAGKAPGVEISKNIGMLYLICQLCSFASTFSPAGLGKGDNPNAMQIAKSMEYIRMNSGRHLTVDDLAREACMARSTYARNFCMVAGCSPMRFLMRCRMAHARRLLCYTLQPVTQVALECGFYDTSHFIHSFVKSEGKTPAEYRALYYHNASYNVCTICRRQGAPAS